MNGNFPIEFIASQATPDALLIEVRLLDDVVVYVNPRHICSIEPYLNRPGTFIRLDTTTIGPGSPYPQGVCFYTEEKLESLLRRIVEARTGGGPVN